MNNTKLKMLFFSQRFLLPMDTGGKIRSGKLLEQLSRDFDITLISNVDSPKDDPYLAQVPSLCSKFHAVPWKEIRKYSPQFYLRVLSMSCSRYPVTALTNYSGALERKIFESLEQDRPDLILCDFLQPSLNFSKVSGYPSILFQHNVESMIVKRHAEAAGNPLMKLFWKSQWKKMARFEREACRKFDAVITVSELDKAILEKEFDAREVHSIPTGIDSAYFSPRPDPVEENTLVFTGSMDWLPNEDAILYFAREILGKINQFIPRIRFAVVGKNPSQRLLNELQKHSQVQAIGRVDDVRPHIARSAIFVIPLRIGGGTRIKAYEAMAMGKAVVSTGIGIEGLPVTHGENVMIADTSGSFAAEIIRLLKDGPLRERLGQSARRFVETNFSWPKVADVFGGICRRVVERRKGGR